MLRHRCQQLMFKRRTRRLSVIRDYLIDYAFYLRIVESTQSLQLKDLYLELRKRLSVCHFITT
jgi:hypothetical protein